MVERFQMKTEHDWICARPDPKGDWVRHSDYEALQAELEQVRRERDEFRDIAARKSNQVAGLIKTQAAERLAGARVVTDEMVKVFQSKYREFWKGSWPDTETSRELLTAALAEPTGDVEPVACVACEDNPKGENNPCAVCGKAATPPDASAIRGAAELARACLAGLVSAGHNFPSPKPEQIETAFWALDAALAGAKP